MRRRELERVIDESTGDPMHAVDVEISRAQTAALIASLQEHGITGAHALTYRWFVAYKTGVDSARTPGTYALARAVGYDLLPVAAKRFAEMFDVDVPSAWILGFKDELERTLRRHACY